MSDLNHINTALERLFIEEEHRLVFWNDPDKEFQNQLPFIRLDGVTTMRLDEVGSLEAKHRLERERPNDKFLIYTPAEEPEYEDDWLLDIRLYSRIFRADRASILLQDLGITQQSVRTHIEKRRKFFDAKERIQKLKTLVVAEDVDDDLDRKMIAVVAKADQPELFNLVRTIFHAWTEEGELDLDNPPACWEQIEKFDLADSFWVSVKTTFGYTEEDPSLKNLLLRLMLTDFAHHLKGEVSQSVKSLLLPRSGWSNTVVCLAQWRDSSSKGSSYDRLSAEAAAILKIEDSLPNYELEQLADIMTFLTVEKRIASCLKLRVQSTADTINADDVRSIVRRRQGGHWASLQIAGEAEIPRNVFNAIYEALLAAADFYALRNQFKGGFDFPDPATMYKAFETEIFRFDQHYRLFCEAADHARKHDILKNLRDDVEACYVNWYLVELGTAWGKFIDGPDGLLRKWQIDGTPNQFDFYERNVVPWLKEGETRRAFVIISDAFRYEAAQELAAELNGKYRFEATLSSQLGVLPSYTPLGMASLLPHKTISYKNKDVLVDGESSAAPNRDDILQGVGGRACKASEVMGMKKDEGREFVKDQRVIYIYHDKVDSTGDQKKTESEVFQAVRETIEDLAKLVSQVVNNLNGHHVVVTADHGFYFTHTPPGETDKSPIKEPDGTVLAKKRYLLGHDLPDHPSVWHGKTSVTAGADGDMEFWIPRGANRFHFAGSSRFIHGGAMLQEIVVPVLTVRHVRGKSAQETRDRSVLVQVLGSNHRITMGKHRFQLIQMEPVSERVKPITLKVAVYDGDEAVTNIETVTFESASTSMDERKKWVPLVLQDREYNKKKPYRLVLSDAETGIEQQSVEVIIDRTFTDDF